MVQTQSSDVAKACDIKRQPENITPDTQVKRKYQEYDCIECEQDFEQDHPRDRNTVFLVLERSTSAPDVELWGSQE